MTATHAESFPRQPQSVAAARAFVGRVLAGHRARADAVLLTSELVTNSYLHGDGTIMVAVTICADRVHVGVLDDGTQGVPYLRAPGAAENGRGLPIVDALAWRWGFLREPEGTSAWFELPSGPQPGENARHAAPEATASPRAGSTPAGPAPPGPAGPTVEAGAGAHAAAVRPPMRMGHSPGRQPSTCNTVTDRHNGLLLAVAKASRGGRPSLVRRLRQRSVRIQWTPAAAASARQYMHDQDGMRAIGVAVAGLADDPYPAEGFHRGRYHRLHIG